MGEVIEQTHRDDLQGLRAIAVLLVVLAHTRVPGFAGGFVGVDVFFVLSGYLITGLLLREARWGLGSIGEFYKRRARRILPAATLTLVTTTIAAYELLNYVRAKQVVWDAIWSAFFAANIHFSRVGTDYFARTQPPSPLQHFWTLAVEEQFYIVWPTILVLAATVVIARRQRLRLSRNRTERRLPLLLAIAATATAASLAYSVIEAGSTSSYFSTLSRAWELGLGCCLAIIAAARPIRLPRLVGWAGIAMIITAGVLFTDATPFPGYAALLPTVGAVAVIAAGVPALAVWPLRYIGDRSYTLYLWHWPFLVIAADRAGHPLSVGRNLALVAVAFAVSIITYRWFEDPIRRQDWSGAATAFAFTGSAALVVAVSVIAISSFDAREAAAAAAQPVAAGPSPQAAARAVSALIAQAGADTGGALPTVVAAVDAAEKGAPIPAGLTPSIGSLLSSEYRYPGGCVSEDGSTSSTLCRMGDTSATRTLAVMGDSHAQMWMPAILALAAHDHWAVVPVGKSACTPDRWAGRHNDRECLDWYRWATGQIRALHPQAVLIGGAYSGVTGSIAAAATAGISDAVAQVGGGGRRVVVIGDPPQQSQQPVDCLLAAHATLKSCTSVWTLANAAEGSQIVTAAGAADAGFIDTQGWFCDGIECPMVIGNTVAYLDTGHITSEYAVELQDVFRAAFEAALKS